jgi:large subunit ribosomal protein L30
MALKLRVTLIRSPINRPELQKRTVTALGLGKLNSVRIINDTPAVRGMIRKVSHMVRVETVE